MPAASPLEVTRTRDTLLSASPEDPWLRWALGEPLPGPAVLVEDVAVVHRPGLRPGLWVAPLRPSPPDAQPSAETLAEERRRVVSALTSVVAAGLPASWGAVSASVPQEHAAAARSVLPMTDEGGDWEWMWTTRIPPADPREDLLVELDDRADAEELRGFAHAHNPRVWTRIGEGRVVRWVAVRDDRGDLVAVGGAEQEHSGVAHLAGILTATSARGQGWGRVVSSALTRWAVNRDGACTLGMFSDNATARRLYRRLGYRTARRWHSRQLSSAAG